MPKRDPNKPRGRCTAYAYFVKACRQKSEQDDPGKKIPFADFSKMCSEKWKALEEQDKKVYYEMSDEDKARYESEMARYNELNGVIGEDETNKSSKTKVKKPSTAYSYFVREMRPKIKNANPYAALADVTKELKRLWEHFEPQSKRKFEFLAEQDKARYERELQLQKDMDKAKAEGQIIQTPCKMYASNAFDGITGGIRYVPSYYTGQQ